MSDVRIELSVKFKNPVLDEALEPIRKQPGGLRAWSSSIGLFYASVWSLLRLKSSPICRDGSFRRPAILISDSLGIPPEVLFPLDLYSGIFEERTVVKDADAETILSLQEVQRTLLLDSESNMLQKDAIQTALSTMTSRDRSIIEKRFGLNGDAPMTCTEIGDEVGLSRARIAQIEQRALRRLRHRSRVKHLQKLLG